MQKLLASGSCGLDFGSGPGPTLHLMFEEIGFNVEIYDKFYHNNPEVFEKQYDFITATEVFEHLLNLKNELNRLFNLLKPGGILGVTTNLRKDKSSFKNWHYKNDMTHICFFSRNTFVWLANKWKAKLNFINNDVILIRRKSGDLTGEDAESRNALTQI